MKKQLKHLLKKWFPTIHPLPAKRLARWEKEILAVPPDIKDKETIKHVEILDYLDNKECRIRNTQRRARSIALIPVTLGIISSLILNIHGFIEDRKNNEVGIHNWIALVKKKYGEEFYLRNDLPDYMEDARYIGNDKDISLRKYLHYRYNYYLYSDSFLKIDIGFLLLYLLIIPPFVWAIFFSRRQAPLIIDRERQIFYTWYKGKAYAARYPQVGMAEKTNIFPQSLRPG
ncbi:hypothetical protein [Photorhabdus luminescens]|uniref:Uncharacterized protein n=1 Tax=Photorhabdus luminescens subsp. mexicana TaxID=2100167 RepID=A0A4R4J654_PHOLU|nr:hypothetical protein [Photorhabdus luminescens]TDB49094.1 hypothetical protein C5468_13610 [Photorhabdus luminescens subsp. mexicana]